MRGYRFVKKNKKNGVLYDLLRELSVVQLSIIKLIYDKHLFLDSPQAKVETGFK